MNALPTVSAESFSFILLLHGCPHKGKKKRLNLTREGVHTNRKAAERPNPGYSRRSRPSWDSYSSVTSPPKRSRRDILHTKTVGKKIPFPSRDLIIRIRLREDGTYGVTDEEEPAIGCMFAMFAMVISPVGGNETYIAPLVVDCLNFDPSPGVAPLSVG